MSRMTFVEAGEGVGVEGDDAGFGEAGGVGDEGLRVDAKTDVVEAEGLDEAEVLGDGVGGEALGGVVGGLGVPGAEIDAAAEVGGALEGEGLAGHELRGLGGGGESNAGEEKAESSQCDRGRS
jgi:hypothetical protein